MIDTPNNLRDNEAQQGYDFAFFLSNLDGGIISYIDKKPPKMKYANISG